MNKTISISLGKSPFIIEEQAYAVLSKYLKEIHAHFAATSHADEIVSDIESRMAEEFMEMLGKNRTIIEMKDIETVIASMGTVEDFQDFESGHAKQRDSLHTLLQKIRLYRDADNQIVAGVAAGIANYFNIDPLIARLAFGLSILLGGFGIVLYIILWVALPEARTTAEKVEMTGGRLTLSAIQQKIDDVVPPTKRKNILTIIITFPFLVIGAVLRALGRIVRVIVPVISRIAGACIVLASAFAIAVLTFALFVALFHPDSPYIGTPVHEAISVKSYTVLLLSGYFVALLPVVFVILIGISLLLLRRLFPVTSILALTFLWFAAGTVGATTLFSVAPQLEPAFVQYHASTEQPFELESFTQILGDRSAHIIVTQGSEYSVVLEGSQRVQESFVPVVHDGVLSLQENRDTDRCALFCQSRRAVLHIIVPRIEQVKAEHSSRIVLENISDSKVLLSTADNARIEGHLQVDSLTVLNEGNSWMELSGTADTLHVEASGNSRLRGEDLVVQAATVVAQNRGRVTVDVRESLQGSASDASGIFYLTEPAFVNIDVSQAASVRMTEW